MSCMRRVNVEQRNYSIHIWLIYMYMFNTLIHVFHAYLIKYNLYLLQVNGVSVLHFFNVHLSKTDANLP